MAGRFIDKEFIFESDCAPVVEKLQADGGDRSVLAGIIDEIQKESRAFPKFTVMKVWREQSKIAHSLDKRAISSMRSICSFSVCGD